MVEIKTEYYENGQVKFEIPFENGKQHGIEKWYYENGKLKWETPFKKGKKHGIEKSYYENGKLKHEAPYKNDMPQDRFKEVWSKETLVSFNTIKKDCGARARPQRVERLFMVR